MTEAELLKEKALLLLKRDREFHSLRQRYARTSGWLSAADDLTVAGRVAQAEHLVDCFAATVVNRLRYQTAAVFEIVDSPPSLVAQACCSSSMSYDRPIPLSPEDWQLLDGCTGGICNGDSGAHPIQEWLDLGSCLWQCVTPKERRRYLAVAGYDRVTSRFHKEPEVEELSYFRMLCQHLESLLGYVLSHLAMRQERENLRQLNAELTRRDAELQQALRELEETQGQLVHGERLAAIGELAAGVAHEINNPAHYAMLNLHHLRSLVGEAKVAALVPEAEEIITETLDGVQRIVTLARELHTFSRTHSGPTEDSGLDQAIDTALRLIDNQLRHRVVVERECCRQALVRGNAGQLAQVFLNLLMNAADAMPDRPRELNTIRIATRIRDGRAVASVEDNGVGMREALVGRVFEPFFTTRKGGGTGLGLSITQKIVQHHGGHIEVRSTPGEGTCFTVVLPLLQLPATHEPTPLDRPPSERGQESQREPSAAERAEGKPQVLIVDDDLLLLRAARRSLCRCFDVVTAAGAKEAFELLPGDFDAVVCDLMMPDISGPEFYRAVCESHPDLGLRFIFATGGAFTAEAQEFVSTCQQPLLEKPFDEAALAAKIALLPCRRSTDA